MLLDEKTVLEIWLNPSFSSTQGSEMDVFAFEQIQGMKASAKPAPKTFLILSSLGCVKFTCKTEAYVS